MRLVWTGLIASAGVVLSVYFFNPLGVRDAAMGLFGAVSPAPGPSVTVADGSVCGASVELERACDFTARVLGTTEDVWRAQFQQGRLPDYGVTPSVYAEPTLIVFSAQVHTGCGPQLSGVGPFYCFEDHRIYIDPTFYQVMEQRLAAPGDFAQAFVIAHEVGHHLQNLLDMRALEVVGEPPNRASVRRELQADCFAGVWAHQERDDLSITEADLREGLNAAFAFGDDTGAGVEAHAFRHGSSEQRMRWLRLGFETGDARECDTFRIQYGSL